MKEKTEEMLSPAPHTVIDKSAELKQGIMVFVGLAVLTLIEYFLGVAQVSAATIVLLWLIALLKGGLVLFFFMHVLRVFRADGGH